MGLTNFPNGVSSFGVPLLGSGPVFTTGKVYFVHQSGSADYPGTDPDRPLATVDAAINKCTAASSTYPGEDYIIVLPGHAESYTAANGFDVDVNGVTVLGLGRGPIRPTFTFADTDATIALGANGLALVNLLCVASIDAVVVMLDIQATSGALMQALEFNDAASIGIVDTVTITDETDLVFRDCAWYETDTGIGQSAILGTTPTNLVVQDCRFHKDAQTGLIELGAAVDALITYNYMESLAPEDLAIVGAATATGWIDQNRIRLADNATNITECITIDTDFQLGRNWVVNADGETAIIHNQTASTDAG